MFVTSHVLAGALIGRVLAGHPAAAFAAGVVTHFAMDACPHYGDVSKTLEDPEFIRMAKCDGCAGLAAMAVAAGLSPGPARRAVIAGMLGCAAVDSDKPFEYFFGWNPWPDWWSRFHKRVQNQAPNRLPHELAVIAGLGLLAWRVLPGPNAGAG
jgi:hypothetical protein